MQQDACSETSRSCRLAHLATGVPGLYHGWDWWALLVLQGNRLVQVANGSATLTALPQNPSGPKKNRQPSVVALYLNDWLTRIQGRIVKRRNGSPHSNILTSAGDWDASI